jgi:hypothetical protein
MPIRNVAGLEPPAPFGEAAQSGTAALRGSTPDVRCRGYCREQAHWRSAKSRFSACTRALTCVASGRRGAHAAPVAPRSQIAIHQFFRLSLPRSLLAVRKHPRVACLILDCLSGPICSDRPPNRYCASIILDLVPFVNSPLRFFQRPKPRTPRPPPVLPSVKCQESKKENIEDQPF